MFQLVQLSIINGNDFKSTHEDIKQILIVQTRSQTNNVLKPKVNEHNEKNNIGIKLLPNNIRTNNKRIPKLIFKSSANEITISI